MQFPRLLSNIINYAVVTQTKVAEGKALARVKILDRETDFYPIVSLSNSFKKHFIPIRPGEQVVVFCPLGEASSGFILRSIFNRSLKEPAGANNTTEVVEYEDGTRFSYDTQSKHLKVQCVGDIEIIAKNIVIKAAKTSFEGGEIVHDGKHIDKTHVHPQNNGNDAGGGVDTSAPSN